MDAVCLVTEIKSFKNYFTNIPVLPVDIQKSTLNEPVQRLFKMEVKIKYRNHLGIPTYFLLTFLLN